MNPPLQSLLALVGRVALAVLFILAGYNKLMAVEGTVGYMEKFGMPLPDLLVWAAIAVELLGGIAIAIGWRTRWAAAALVIFVLIASVIFHQYWAVDPAQMVNQRNHFMKNLAICGGMLLLMAFGPGRWSVDSGANR